MWFVYMFVEFVGKFDVEIELEKDGERIDGKSIFLIFIFVVSYGEKIIMIVLGFDVE